MSERATRLLHLLDELRRRRNPVRGAQLAERLGVSLRTLAISTRCAGRARRSPAIPAWGT